MVSDDDALLPSVLLVLLPLPAFLYFACLSVFCFPPSDLLTSFSLSFFVSGRLRLVDIPVIPFYIPYFPLHISPIRRTQRRRLIQNRSDRCRSPRRNSRSHYRRRSPRLTSRTRTKCSHPPSPCRSRLRCSQIPQIPKRRLSCWRKSDGR